jgi:O-antigen ligase
MDDKTMSNDKTKKKDNASSFDRYRVNRPIDIVNTLFLIFMTSIFCLYMHNKYFDITGTRGSVFIHTGLVYIILAIVSYFIEIVMIRYYEPGSKLFYKDSKIWAMPELWVLLFLVANFFAWMMSTNKAGSWDGSTGRKFGLAMVMTLAFVFIIMAREAIIHEYVLCSMFATSNIIFIIAFLQHFGNDPFNLRARVVARQKEMFISTFGNINTYGSYLCIVIPIFVALFVFSRQLWVRILSGILIVEAAIAIIPAKSDNVYLGCGVAFVVLFYLAVYYKRFTEYIFAVMLLGIGLLIMAILNSAWKGSQKHINGIAEVVENPKVMLLFVMLVAGILIASMIFRGINYEKYKAVQSTKLLIIVTVLLVLGSVSVVIYGIKSKMSFFVFDDKWGTFRGYIWRRSWSLFTDHSTPLQKLFGHGNETVAELMRKYYYEEMVSITHKKYDNCHNELLQYLVTTGIFGVVSYVGFAVSSLVYILRRLKGDAVAIACLASGMAYFAQAMVNLNQPITTPFFFITLAAGIGYIRYRDQGYGKFKTKDE